jgi:hypothetical protein
VDPLTERDLVDRWIIADAVYSPPPDLGSSLDGGRLLGFVYVDHECGTTLQVTHVCRLEGERVQLGRDLLHGEGMSLKMRWGSFRPLRWLADSERARLSLVRRPDWLAIYEVKGIERLRAATELDPLRAPGYPDDIRVLLRQPGMKGIEAVWARMEGSADGFHIDCTLLNQPFESCGLSAGDRVVVVVLPGDGGEGGEIQAYCIGPAGSTLERFLKTPTSKWPVT